MITKTKGLVRNLIKKRASIIPAIKAYIESDEVILLTVTDNKFNAMGHTSSAAMNVLLIGHATAASWPAARDSHSDATIADYLSQPTGVALRILEKNGELTKESLGEADVY